MSLKEVRRWEARLAWLESILDPRPLTTHLASTKVEQFAAEAYRLEAGDRLDVLDEAKRHTLLLYLLHYVQVRTRDQLDAWLLEAEGSGITVLRNFATGLRRDYDAVKAALTYEWSAGQTEGQIDRIKLLKLEAYGRAKFDLLRRRVIGMPVAT